MKRWQDLTEESRAEYVQGEVKIHRIKYPCWYRFIDEDTIEFYYATEEHLGCPHYTHYKSLVTTID
jgi:hypothetical protein